MPRNKVVTLVTNVANGSAVTIQPSSGQRWLLVSVETAILNGPLAIQRSDGTTHMTIQNIYGGYIYFPFRSC
ncbi:MAG: hypothetical protein RML40_12370 [Bacteroidota bacterium]|nr:hypothetical protein [Bacteroidota bacterium]